MESYPGYCDRCEIHTTIKKTNHCSVCYQDFCDNCYYKEVYDDDLCEKCFKDMERESKGNILKKLEKLTESIESLKKDTLEYKQKQGLLVALETIPLCKEIRPDDLTEVKYIIKDLLLNGKSTIVDNDVNHFISIIEKFSGLKINKKRKNQEWYIFEISVI